MEPLGFKNGLHYEPYMIWHRADDDFIAKTHAITNSLYNQLPVRYYISDEATVLIWGDGTKTLVRKTQDDTHNKRLAFLTAYFQKHCGLPKHKANKYLESLEDKEQIKAKK